MLPGDERHRRTIRIRKVGPLGLTIADGRQDLDALFGRQAPRVVEIGFGMGSSLIDMARKESKTNFLGIEVHKPGIGKTLNDVELYAIKNLKLICHDATEVFQNAFKNKSLDRILIYFPDPWPKKRHAKRRLIQSEFATIISEKLKISQKN